MLVARLLGELGLKHEQTIINFGVGWDGEAYTIPAFNGSDEMIGIMRRFLDSGKMWVSRSRNGLFIPKMKSYQGNVFVTEGFSDAAALTDMGFRAMGRSNCDTGTAYIKRWVYYHKDIRQVTVVADNDLVGHNGALRLAHELYGAVPHVGVLDVPEEYKDVREWVREGTTRQGIIDRSRQI
jgi:DNA primase